MNTLDILKKARVSIANDDWVFGRWNKCTCGHIYSAALGRDVDEYTVIHDMNHPALVEVANLLGWDNGKSTPLVNAGIYISDYTDSGLIDADSSPDDGPSRESGIIVIDEAIAKLEAQYEKDRLDVLAQMRKVVNDVKVEDDSRSYVA